MGTTVSVKGYTKQTSTERARIDAAARSFAGRKKVTLSGRTVYRFKNHTAAHRFAALATPTR